MNNILWLLALVILFTGSVFVIVPLLRIYAALQGKIVSEVFDLKDDLSNYHNHLMTLKDAFETGYSVKDAEPYRSSAQKFQESLADANNEIFYCAEKRRKILQSIPRHSQNPIASAWGMFGFPYRWINIDHETQDLRLSVKQINIKIEQVNQALNKVYCLPWEVALSARTMRQISWETRSLLEELHQVRSIDGAMMQDALKVIRDTENSLNAVPAFFYSLSQEKLSASPDIKLDTEKTYHIIAPGKDSIQGLYNNAREWKAIYEELKKTLGTIQARLNEVTGHYLILERSLVLPGEKEELALLRQMTGQVLASFESLTVEKLKSTLRDAKQTSALLENLNNTLHEYAVKLKRLSIATEKISKRIAAADGLIRATANRAEYPINWTISAVAFDELNQNFLQVPPFSQLRTPAELKANLAIIEACDAPSKALLEAITRIKVDTEQLFTLWQQMRLTYTSEWIKRVEELFVQVNQYDIDQNWNQADNVRALLSDATELMKQAYENLPASLSAPVNEQNVDEKLENAIDLLAKKPGFDKRKERIHIQLVDILKAEQTAWDIFSRVSPALYHFSKDIRDLQLNSLAAQNLLESDERILQLDYALRQRKIGKVFEKLEYIRAWEKDAVENGLRVYTWINDDLSAKREELARHLQVIKTVAENLEDEIVAKAHQYKVAFIEPRLDIHGIQTISLDALQKQASGLLRKRQEIVSCDQELTALIAPIIEIHARMLHSLQGLRGICSQMQINFRRSWPPVFQSLNDVEIKIGILETDISASKAMIWKKDELLRNYYYLRARLKEIRANLEEIKELDRIDSEETNILEQEYRIAVAKFADKLYKDDFDNSKKEIQTGNAYLKFLSGQYQSGNLTAVEVKARLKSKMESVKQQVADVSGSNVTNVSVEQKLD
ncbi:MAG: hypothetical protein NT121_04560 [Chloroflexi bacterium]|nr:hypothetical protein [Chloroflexota bacterium]